MDIKFEVTLVECGGECNFAQLRDTVRNALFEVCWSKIHGFEDPSLVKVAIKSVSSPMLLDEEMAVVSD